MMHSKEMTPAMIDAAYELERASMKYKKLYEAANTKGNMIYVNNGSTGFAAIITTGRYIPSIQKAVFDKDIEDMT